MSVPRRGTSAHTCSSCSGKGEVPQLVKSFLADVMTSRPCPHCQGYGTVVPTPCPECTGDGRVRSRRSLTVKIPGGVENGTRIQLAGEGEAGPAGDLYGEIFEITHPIFHRRGDDIHCTVTIPTTAAVLTTQVPLRTLDGLEGIRIRPGTQYGRSIPLQPGITHQDGNGRGDLIMHIEVTTPSKLDPEREWLVRRLAALRNEEQPSSHVTPGGPGLFSHLTDAFNSR